MNIQDIITLIRSGSSNSDHREGQRQIEEAVHLLEKMQAANQWQPMETAPKDGTSILLGHQHLGVFAARFIDGKWRSPWDGKEIHCVETCRWQRQPALPREPELFTGSTENHTLVASEKALRDAFGDNVIDEVVKTPPAGESQPAGKKAASTVSVVMYQDASRDAYIDRVFRSRSSAEEYMTVNFGPEARAWIEDCVVHD